MPIYEFTCRDCGHSFEIVQSLARHETGREACASCGSQRVERRWTNVFAVTSKKS